MKIGVGFEAVDSFDSCLLQSATVIYPSAQNEAAVDGVTLLRHLPHIDGDRVDEHVTQLKPGDQPPAQQDGAELPRSLLIVDVSHPVNMSVVPMSHGSVGSPAEGFEAHHERRLIRFSWSDGMPCPDCRRRCGEHRAGS
jgi:hypothetical protein